MQQSFFQQSKKGHQQYYRMSHLYHLFLTLLMLFLILICSPANGAITEVTILVDDAYKPFSYEEEGIAKGMYVEILRTAFTRMDKYKVSLKPVPWKRGKKIMEEGKGFGLTPAFFHGHDWPYLYPYSLPFYTEKIIAVCDKKVLEKPRPNWPEDFIGLRIGNVAGFDGWGGEAFRRLVKNGKIAYEEAKGSNLNIVKLGKGRVDCIMMEEKAFDYQFKRLKETGKYDEGGKDVIVQKANTIGTDPVYIGYSRTARLAGKYPFQDDFMQELDSILYKMLKNGEIDKIMADFGE